MVLCKNGHPNPEGATYCRVCRVYIEADAPHVEPEPQPTPVTAQPDPSTQPQPAPPEVSLSEASLQAAPGGEASCEVRVQNPGAVPDEYTVEVLGEAAAWVLVDPWHLSVAPGAGATAWATFRPDAAAAAGMAVPFEVKVTSKLLLDQPVSSLGVLQLTGAPSPPPDPAHPEPEPEAKPTLAQAATPLSSVRGVVRNLDQRVEWRSASEKPLTIFTFRVECLNEAAQTVTIVPVEMRAVSFRGALAEGDTVQIGEPWTPGETLETRRVENLSTGAWFGEKPKRHLGRKILLAALIVILAVIVAQKLHLGG